MTTELIDMDKIDIKASPQIRVCEHEPTIQEYWNALIEGDKFPPIDLFYSNEKNAYVIADGHQRYWAHARNNEQQILAVVHEGGEREALLFALGANQKHGLRRTDADKRRAVEIVVKDVEWMSWTDRRIAEKLAVSHPLVAKIRKEHAPDIKEKSVNAAAKGADASVGNISNTQGDEESVALPRKRKGKDGREYEPTKPTAKTPTAKTGTTAEGKESISPEQRKDAKAAFGAFVRCVNKVPAWKALLAERLDSIAEDMKSNWSRGGK